MSDPDVIGDRERYAEVGRAYSALEPAHQLATSTAGWPTTRPGRASCSPRTARTPSCARCCRARSSGSAELDEEIRLAMVEPDPNDDKNVIVEVRGGDRRRGGRPVRRRPLPDALALRRAARLQGRAAVGVTDGDYTFEIKGGGGAYSVFKYEGGTHRVQRVPETESQGRIHTSTATVAVLPEAEEVDVHIDPNDLQIDVYRSSGPGRPVGEHDRLRGAHHAQAHGTRRRRCRTRSRSSRTARRRCGCCARGSTSRSWPRSRQSCRPSARRRSGAASAPRRSAPTTSRRIA